MLQFRGELQRFVQLPGRNWDEMDDCLHAFTRLAQQWAKARKLDLYIKPLTVANCGLKQIGYPELSSRVKASRARVLLSFCCHYVVALGRGPWCKPRRFNEGSDGSESRFCHLHFRHGWPPSYGALRRPAGMQMLATVPAVLPGSG